MSRARAGFTLIELMIVMALVSIVIVKVAMFVNTASRAEVENSSAIALEDQARRVLDQLAYAVMGSSRETLFPDPESPIFSTTITYEISLGVDETGEVVWGDPERVGLVNQDNQVVWAQNPDTETERRVVWCNTVRPFLQGELQNGVDDNGNGLVDEQGLTFALRGDSVEIRLTLERIDSQGNTITQSVQTIATCRN